ncbi:MULTISPECIES: hypothetical protein [unclassified Flavobacterium]|uniref:hypothetical protein n=1 Tax=unclassified Flavobacterium TaxID=196869 RepID=UPI00095BB5F8|nr:MULTISPECIES: hypothetical protein [unclassified Flavobacterium]MBN9284104.1 hypothetical protein [Flavobacterium sp.]OJV71119.1 MAG: hypothetical protein BGO42_04715 [Flavobacterium sp. 40-81]
MKTLKTAVAALLIAGGAIGAFAFTKADSSKVNNQQTNLHWYTPDGQTSLGVGENPNNGCIAEGKGCAIGFSDPNADPTVDTPDQTRAFN